MFIWIFRSFFLPFPHRDDCMVRIHNFLSKSKFDHAVILLRSAREIWPENDLFGSSTAQPEDELFLLRDIFISNLKSGEYSKHFKLKKKNIQKISSCKYKSTFTNLYLFKCHLYLRSIIQFHLTILQYTIRPVIGVGTP